MSEPAEHHRPQHGDSADLRSFGRRRTRKFTARQRSLMEALWPRYALDPASPAPDAVSGIFSGKPRAVWLEIGFGGGEHLVWQAEYNPDVGLIGCEPFLDGTVKVLDAIEAKGLHNIRLYGEDARDILRWLPAGSLDRAFILFPDPWPKKRHNKRRLVNPATLQLLARATRTGGELRLATDIADYARFMLLSIREEGSFAWQAARPSDWRVRPPDWPQTRYEQKALREGRRSYYLQFTRT
jgi:tRNA (guanine-N7-)-methyltransferase